MSDFFGYFAENAGSIGLRALEHCALTAAALAVAIPIGVGLGILLTRSGVQRAQRPALWILGLGQTIPSLAILALGMSLFGIGAIPAGLALVLYAILPITLNTVAGIGSVPVAALDAGRGMGMTSGQILRDVELPLASPFFLAGIRTATVVTISAAALAYLIGAGGLGDFIFTGISLFRPEAMLAGAIPTAILALAADFALGRAQKRLEKRYRLG